LAKSALFEYLEVRFFFCTVQRIHLSRGVRLVSCYVGNLPAGSLEYTYTHPYAYTDPYHYPHPHAHTILIPDTETHNNFIAHPTGDLHKTIGAMPASCTT